MKKPQGLNETPTTTFLNKNYNMYCIYLNYLVASISKVGTYLIFIQKFKYTLRTSDMSKPDIINPVLECCTHAKFLDKFECLYCHI